MSYLKLDENKLEPVVDELNLLLANYNVYYQKLRSFHWNILGENFFVLHDKFEELYTDARIKIDEIAERILTLRYHPVSDFSSYLKMGKIKEESALLTDKQMIGSILDDHGLLLEQMRVIVSKANSAGDEGTIDIIGGYIRELEKTSWMLNAWKKDTREQLKTNKMERVS
ncbi:starvation-inducible DNA-binding protein [Maribacter vaceletii]|uniref:Starvation-inducible DNA-binding protein n=1 Tax=Maribacter vaceletii TaxID=1206816 RepID=A0A495DU49_9FLAO|nr:Dps family protein [Maribacter vaceletii]RKR08023.1 starvation-inducible DNA-binding protein [Maribacter vaceletii]